MAKMTAKASGTERAVFLYQCGRVVPDSHVATEVVGALAVILKAAAAFRRAALKGLATKARRYQRRAEKASEGIGLALRGDAMEGWTLNRGVHTVDVPGTGCRVSLPPPEPPKERKPREKKVREPKERKPREKKVREVAVPPVARVKGAALAALAKKIGHKAA